MDIFSNFGLWGAGWTGWIVPFLFGLSVVVFFHELGHFLFHTPESGETANFHGVGRRTRKEFEADIFALCALIPKYWIENRHPQELIDDESFSAEMVEARQKIFANYGI